MQPLHVRRRCEVAIAGRDVEVMLWWQTEILITCPDTALPWVHKPGLSPGSGSGTDASPSEGAEDEAQRSDHTGMLSRSDRYPGGFAACRATGLTQLGSQQPLSLVVRTMPFAALREVDPRSIGRPERRALMSASFLAEPL